MFDFNNTFDAFEEIFALSYRNEAERFFQIVTLEQQHKTGQLTADEAINKMRRFMHALIKPETI